MSEAELNELAFDDLIKLIHKLPEHLNHGVVHRVLALVISVSLKQFNVDSVPTTDPNLKFFGSHDVKKR